MKWREWRQRYRKWRAERLLQDTCANRCDHEFWCEYMWREGFAQAKGCPRAHMLYGTAVEKERIARKLGL